MNHTVDNWSMVAGVMFTRRLVMVEEDHAGHEEWEYYCTICSRYLGNRSAARNHAKKH